MDCGKEDKIIFINWYVSVKIFFINIIYFIYIKTIYKYLLHSEHITVFKYIVAYFSAVQYIPLPSADLLSNHFRTHINPYCNHKLGRLPYWFKPPNCELFPTISDIFTFTQSNKTAWQLWKCLKLKLILHIGICQFCHVRGKFINCEFYDTLCCFCKAWQSNATTNTHTHTYMQRVCRRDLVRPKSKRQILQVKTEAKEWERWK